MCVSAFPDVQPWQVRKACLGRMYKSSSSRSSSSGTTTTATTPTSATELKKSISEDILHDFYYSYLTMLMDPVEGHDDARHDANLVEVRTGFLLVFFNVSISVTSGHKIFNSTEKMITNILSGPLPVLTPLQEWCKWSVGINDDDDDDEELDNNNNNNITSTERTTITSNNDDDDENDENDETNTKRRQHFFSVASRTSSNDHLSYRRDLVMLLNLSLLIHEYDLALDLGTSILLAVFFWFLIFLLLYGFAICVLVRVRCILCCKLKKRKKIMIP